MRGLPSVFAYVRGTPTGMAALVLGGILLVLAVIGPQIWWEQANALQMSAANQGPSALHWLGTDRVGRDALARTLAATRLSLILATLAAALGAILGMPLGAVTAVVRPSLQRFLGRSIQLGLSFPPILVALFLITVIGPGLLGATVAIGVALAPGFARTAQTLAASIATSDFMSAARVVGLSNRKLLARYVLPNISETLILQAFGSVSVSLIAISALSFLGLGVQAPAFDWGRMLADGLEAIYVNPAAALTPALAIIGAGLAFNLLGESIARGLNPTLRARGFNPLAPGPDIFAGQPVQNTATGNAVDSMLSIRHLSVLFPRAGQVVRVVDRASFDIRPGEIVGIVGESGSGKTMLTLAIAQLVPPPGRVIAESLRFKGENLLEASPRALRRLLGTQMAIVFQDPSASLNPVLRIGRQLTEAVEEHQSLSHAEALKLAEQRLREVHIPAPHRRLLQYPHEFSGGMKQRAMIAMGLMGNPALLLADEPTTALDVTVQAQILELISELNARSGTAVLMVSHDLAVIAQVCSRVMVMYAGRIVEIVDVLRLLSAPAHPYTQALMSVVPDLDTDRTKPLANIPGQPPDIDAIPRGCPFHPRCPWVIDRCRDEMPQLLAVAKGQEVACWVAQDRAAKAAAL
jgi:peptide/nickel transport system permease protein